MIHVHEIAHIWHEALDRTTDRVDHKIKGIRIERSTDTTRRRSRRKPGRHINRAITDQASDEKEVIRYYETVKNKMPFESERNTLKSRAP